MGHDVIADRYARLYEQPFQLAQLGHDVLGVCLSYRNCAIKDETHNTGYGSLRWIGFSSGQYRQSMLLYPMRLLKIAREFKPDIIVGASDCLHVILGQWLANQLKIKYAADLYDAYETFGLAKIPFVKFFYKRAIGKAHVISCVSQSLSLHIKAFCTETADVLALPSTINKSIFYPRNRNEMRNIFNLPIDAPIIGTAGGLTKEKGIDTVYQAFEILAKQLPSAHFVIAGVLDKNYLPPKHDRIHYLGMLSHEKVAELFCTLDVGIVYLKDTKYGQFSFPQKAFEMAACKIPMVVARIGDMKYLFSDANNELYSADNAKELSNAISLQLNKPYIPALQIDDWAEQARHLQIAYAKAIDA